MQYHEPVYRIPASARLAKVALVVHINWVATRSSVAIWRFGDLAIWRLADWPIWALSDNVPIRRHKGCTPQCQDAKDESR